MGAVVGYTSCNVSGYQQWATTDLNADGLPDLVVASDCQDPTVGHTVWKAHVGVCP